MRLETSASGVFGPVQTSTTGTTCGGVKGVPDHDPLWGLHLLTNDVGRDAGAGGDEKRFAPTYFFQVRKHRLLKVDLLGPILLDKIGAFARLLERRETGDTPLGLVDVGPGHLRKLDLKHLPNSAFVVIPYVKDPDLIALGRIPGRETTADGTGANNGNSFLLHD